VESQPGQGTRFTLNMPLGKEHLLPEQVLEVPFGSADPYSKGLLPDLRAGEGERTISDAETITDTSQWKTPRRLSDRRTVYPSQIEIEAILPDMERQSSSKDGGFQAELPASSSLADGETVLVVDDNYDMRKYIVSVLSPHYQVLEAVNGEQGLETAISQKPEIILSDVMMSKMDGNQMLKAIRAHEQTSHIPMILLTAKASEDLRLESLEAGADDYLSKPFNSNELLSRVKNLLHLKSREKDLVKNVLKRYLPPDLVDKMMESQHELDGKPKAVTATILFSDLVGFTRTTSKLRATRMAGILNEYLAEMIEIIFEAGGTIDKFIGDAIMVIFGAPLEMTSSQQVEKACLCAMSMQGAMKKLNEKWQESRVAEIKMRIGIHHGPAVVGNFGSEQRTDYTAIGPVVNLASRIEGACAPGNVFISGEVSDYLPEEMFEDAGDFNLKGVQGETSLYKLMVM